MVHFFTFNYQKQEYYFIWDIESGSLYEVGEVAFLFAKKLYSSLNKKEESLYNKLVSDNESINLTNTFKKLEENGSLNSKQKVKTFEKKLDFIKAICLHICHDCNLNCDYCFAGGGKYNTPNDYMTFDIGKKAIDFLIESSGSIKNIEVDFFGGEPLMNFDVVKSITEYGKEKAKISNKNIFFTITTNCLLLNKEKAKYLNETMDNIVLSIDGRKSTHSSVRHSLNNKDIFNTVLDNAKYFAKIRNGKKYYVRGTFTRNNLDFSKDVNFLRKQGFSQISLEPVVLPNEHSLSIKEEHLDKIFKEYDILAKSYIADRQQGDWYNFFHFMLDLSHGPCLSKRLTGCGAGVEYLAISPSGDIYPCHQFVGKKDYIIGNLFNGIQNNNVRKLFAKNTVLIKNQCKSCPAKYFCGGGCASNALNFSGSIYNTYNIGCEMIIKRFEHSLAISAIEKIQF